MLFQSTFVSIVSFTLFFAYATAAPSGPKAKLAKPPAIFLAGDSTTAVQATNGGGEWSNLAPTCLPSKP